MSANDQAIAVTAKFNNMRRMLESEGVQLQIQRALPDLGITPERLARTAITALQTNSRLLDCTQGSVVKSLVQAAELGLEVNTPLGLAFLIPYSNVCTLQLGYKGFIQLAHRSGRISYIASEVVFENDLFNIMLGTHRRIDHVPAKGPRGERIGVYAVVRFKDGTTDFEYMTAEEVEAVKKRSPGAKKNDSPWNGSQYDQNEMWRKTPIRRLFKRLPASAIDTDILVKAAVIDEYNEVGAPTGHEIPDPPKPQLITEDQRVELANAFKKGGTNATEILHKYGFEIMADVTVDAFNEVIADALAGPGAPPEPEKAPEVEGEPMDAQEAHLIEMRDAITELFKDKKLTVAQQDEFLEGYKLGEATEEQLDQWYHKLLQM